MSDVNPWLQSKKPCEWRLANLFFAWGANPVSWFDNVGRHEKGQAEQKIDIA
jgi:hypothetical protein